MLFTGRSRCVTRDQHALELMWQWTTSPSPSNVPMIPRTVHYPNQLPLRPRPLHHPPPRPARSAHQSQLGQRSSPSAKCLQTALLLALSQSPQCSKMTSFNLACVPVVPIPSAPQADEFFCWLSEDVTCIPASFQCDYTKDCPLGEDEQGCGEAGIEFQCKYLKHFKRFLDCFQVGGQVVHFSNNA